MSKRPKDMTNEELMALPEMFGSHFFTLGKEDIKRGFVITTAGRKIPLRDDAVVGDTFRIPYVVKLFAQGFEPDDIMMFSDHEGAWIPVQREFGRWYKQRFLL